MEVASRERDEAKAESEQQQRQAQELSARTEELEKTFREREACHQEALAGLGRSLDETREQVADSARRLEEKTGHVESLQAALDQQNRERENERRDLHDQLDALRREIESIRNEATAERERAAQLADSLRADLQRQGEEAREQLQQAISKAESLEAELRETSQASHLLEAELVSARGRVATLTQELETAQTAKEQIRALLSRIGIRLPSNGE